MDKKYDRSVRFARRSTRRPGPTGYRTGKKAATHVKKGTRVLSIFQTRAFSFLRRSSSLKRPDSTLVVSSTGELDRLVAASPALLYGRGGGAADMDEGCLTVGVGGTGSKGNVLESGGWG